MVLDSVIERCIALAEHPETPVFEANNAARKAFERMRNKGLFSGANEPSAETSAEIMRLQHEIRRLKVDNERLEEGHKILVREKKKLEKARSNIAGDYNELFAANMLLTKKVEDLESQLAKMTERAEKAEHKAERADRSEAARKAWATRRANGWIHPKSRPKKAPQAKADATNAVEPPGQNWRNPVARKVEPQTEQPKVEPQSRFEVVRPWGRKTNDKEAAKLVRGWKDNDGVRSYLAKKFPHFVTVEKAEEAQQRAAETLGACHIQFYGRVAAYDSSRGGDGFDAFEPVDNLEYYDPGIADFRTASKVVIEMGAKWALVDHDTFYFADVKDAVEYKLRFC